MVLMIFDLHETDTSLLVAPLIATLSLSSALAYWNRLGITVCSLYYQVRDMFTLQYYLQRMLGSAEAMENRSREIRYRITIRSTGKYEDGK